MHTQAAPPNMSAEPHHSIQRRWQLARLAEGKCQECGAEPRKPAERGAPRLATLGVHCSERQNAERRAKAAAKQTAKRAD